MRNIPGKKMWASILTIGFMFAPATAFAAGSISVSPHTGLTNGQTVTVSGTGLAASSTGTIVECNNDPHQPNVTVAGNAVPVSCTNPLNTLITTDKSGNLAPKGFVVRTGVIGPAATGTDSAGRDAAADAANYPCPPTAAQVAAGDVCVITVGDAGGDDLSQTISFATASSGSGSGSSSSSSSSSAGSSTTNGSTSGSSAAGGQTTLTNTGPGSTLAIFVATAVVATLARYAYLLRQRKLLR